MSARASQILQQAMALTAEERADLAAELLESLDRDAADGGAEQAWHDEVVRRADEVARGQAKLVTWEDVKARLDAKYPRR